MPFIEVGNEFADGHEAQLVPNGRYNLRCAAADYINEADKKQIRVRIVHDDDVDGIKNPSPIFHYISIPMLNTPPDKKETMIMFMQRFLHYFEVPHEGNGFNHDDIVDCTCSQCPVTQSGYTLEGQTKERFSNNLDLPAVPEGAWAAGVASQGSRRRKSA